MMFLDLHRNCTFYITYSFYTPDGLGLEATALNLLKVGYYNHGITRWTKKFNFGELYVLNHSVSRKIVWKSLGIQFLPNLINIIAIKFSKQSYLHNCFNKIPKSNFKTVLYFGFFLLSGLELDCGPILPHFKPPPLCFGNVWKLIKVIFTCYV